MEIIGLIATVVIFVLLFAAVFKKLNMKATLCFLCIVALLVAAALGTDAIPEKSGLIWFDVFAYLPTCLLYTSRLDVHHRGRRRRRGAVGALLRRRGHPARVQP